MKTNKHYRRGLMLAVDLALAALLIAADQCTKYLAIRNLKGMPAIVLIDGVLELDYLENHGSAFGILQNQKVFILFVCGIFLALILFLLLRLPTERKFIASHIFFSFVIAGGIGNMIDRIRYDYVVDFVSFVLIHFPIFNFADSIVVIAVFALFILFLFVYKESDLEFLNFKRTKFRKMD